MNDITLTIRVSATEAAMAGIDHFGDVAVTVKPSALTEAARQVLARLLARKDAVTTGAAVYDKDGQQYYVLPVPMQPTLETTAQWLESCAVAFAATKEQREKAKVEQARHDVERTKLWCEQPVEQIIRKADRWVPVLPYSFARSLQAEVRARLAEAQKVCDAHNAEVALQHAKAEADKAEAAKRHADQIAAWIATASEPMRKRHARGLLPEEDIIAAIRNEAYAPLDHLPRYQRMSDDDVRSELDAEDDEQEVDYVTREADYVTREAESAHDEDIELMEQIESLLPGAKCTLLEHAGWLTDAAGIGDPEVTRYAVKVAIKVGELEFTREYAARQGEK